MLDEADFGDLYIFLLHMSIMYETWRGVRLSLQFKKHHNPLNLKYFFYGQIRHFTFFNQQ